MSSFTESSPVASMSSAMKMHAAAAIQFFGPLLGSFGSIPLMRPRRTNASALRIVGRYLGSPALSSASPHVAA